MEWAKCSAFHVKRCGTYSKHWRLEHSVHSLLLSLLSAGHSCDFRIQKLPCKHEYMGFQVSVDAF